ncbi:GrpB family protein [Lentibacillus sp. Marseille-P4043]|uniref:GrpB family protein n=1 Tax=Lentibacillus sp. Marseille-P4043 TaxID=2040293 RepID=UPI000D0B3470|nr:GrpB family protein [Lentibacillus sp. Marseille-P4043]
MRKVVVTDHNEKWPLMFAEEAAKLRGIFGSEITSIHHIGSTSVKGLKAKPIIDMMPLVKNIESVDSFNDAMKKIGYEAKGENGIPGRRYFQKGGDTRTHHVHIFESGNHEGERHIAFRDYLRAHSDTAEKYGNLKESLAKRFPNDVEAYIKGKEQLVLEIERQAITWYQA